MRTVRSFDPCLPCGVHMYLGEGKTLAEIALPDPDGHRGVTTTAGRCSANPGSSIQTSGARPAIGSRRCSTPAADGRAQPHASVPSSWSARSSTSTAPAWAGSSRSTDPAAVGALRRRRSGGEPAAGARPASARHRSGGSPTPWTACGRISARTAVTSNCSISWRARTEAAQCCCASRAAARAARRRRSRWSWPSKTRCVAARPRSRRSRSSRRKSPASAVIPADSLMSRVHAHGATHAPNDWHPVPDLADLAPR